MSQRKALIASLVITILLALSALGIRAVYFDSQDGAADPPDGMTLVVPGSESYDDEDNGDDDDDDSWYSNQTDGQDDHDDDEDEDEEDEHD